jgi:hypothetical protein
MRQLFLFILSNGLINNVVETANLELYEDNTMYGDFLCKFVETTDSDIIILETWHWTGTEFGTHIASGGPFYVWDEINFEYVETPPAPIITNLIPVIANEQNQYVELNWDVEENNWPDYPWEYQVLFSPLDDILTATLLTTTIDKFYINQNNPYGPSFYWVGATWDSGAWAGPLSQVSISLAQIEFSPSAITPTTIISSASSSVGSSFSIGNVTSWSTWTNFGNISFTVPETGTGNVNGYISTTLSYADFSGPDIFKVIVRFRLYDTTASSYVPGEESYYHTYNAAFGSQLGSLQIVNHNYNYRYGALGNLIIGNSYRIELDVIKTRTGTGTLNVALSTSAGSIDANSVS